MPARGFAASGPGGASDRLAGYNQMFYGVRGPLPRTRGRVSDLADVEGGLRTALRLAAVAAGRSTCLMRCLRTTGEVPKWS